MNFQRRNIVITGVGQGIGLNIAISLGRMGGRIFGIDCDERKLKEFQDLGKREGLEFSQYLGDVSNEDDVVGIFEEIVKSAQGRIDILVNNAGITKDGLLIKKKDNELFKFSLTDWQHVIDVNLTGVFLCGREAAYWMVKNGNKGVIINISSISREGNIGQSNYSASKAGVASLIVVWAKELSRHGIRVVGIAPGFIHTDMTKQLPVKVLDRIKKQIPVGDLGQPDDIAKTVIFIMDNKYINGRILEIDGGLRL